jgi:DNA mismatch endonuclease, patch repair protein
MADVHTKEQRTYNMSRIRSKNTSPELIIRKMLFAEGHRGYRIYYDLPGRPDIVFVKKKIAIFIDGCFWHKCPFDFQEPATRKEFWLKKIDSNVERDKRVNDTLQSEGWIVLRFWEHEVKKDPNNVIEKILERIKN